MTTILILATVIYLAMTFDPLVTPSPSQKAQNLYSFLQNNYGTYVLSGQTTFNYDEFVTKTGQKPLIRGFDMQNYSPHNPWYNWQPTDDGTVTKAINWYLYDTRQQGIVTFFWHWFSPMGGQLRISTFYTNNTDFNLTKALLPGSEENNATLRDLDAIASQLKRLQEARVPILWRPLHQAGGKWFWWGSKTSAEAKQLYRMMFERFVNYHKLDNLIWVWSTPESDWYPGHQSVDIIGYDSYPGSYNYGCREDIYSHLYGIVSNRKMIDMTENGPIPSMEECLRMRVNWGFFMTWNELTFTQNTIDHIFQVYKSPVIKKLYS